MTSFLEKVTKIVTNYFSSEYILYKLLCRLILSLYNLRKFWLYHLDHYK